MVPVDDCNTLTIGWRFFNPDLDPDGKEDRNRVGKEMIDFVGQTEGERSYEERQRRPGDYEAQVSQRRIAIHALEHLATSDTGVARLRRMLRERVRQHNSGGAVSHPASPVSTYAQDTVWPRVGALSNIEARDTEKLRALGRGIATVVMESAGLPYPQRVRAVRAYCNDLTQPNAFAAFES
jgi:hypothetical protein